MSLSTQLISPSTVAYQASVSHLLDKPRRPEQIKEEIAKKRVKRSFYRIGSPLKDAKGRELQGLWSRIHRVFVVEEGGLPLVAKRPFAGKERQEEIDILRLVTKENVPHCSHLVAVQGRDIILDYLQAPSLDHLQAPFFTHLAHQVLSIEKIRMIAKQCLECLSKLKDLDVIHGDIKKSNLIWEPIYNYLTLIDFGFAERCKKSTRVIQSNFYRAPEIFLGKEHDESADMWSVGCLFFSLFTNEEIFSYPIFLNEKGNEIKKKLYIFLLNKIQAHVGPIPQKWLEETLHKDILLQKDENDKYQLKPSKYIVFIPGLDLSWQERMRKQGVNRNLNENQKRELEALIDLTSRMLTYDRITPKEALSHSFFQGFDIPFYIRLKDREESVSMDVYLISSEEKEVEEDFQENEVEFFCRLPSHRFENTCLHLPANKGECYLRIYHHDEGYEIIDDIPVKITPHSTLVIDSQQRQIKLIKA